MLNQFKLEVTPLNLLLTGIVGIVAYKSIAGWVALGKVVDMAIDPVIEEIADAYVEANNPIVNAQIKIKPQYFENINISNPMLNIEALNVIKNGYPVLFSTVFDINGRIHSEYEYIIGNDKPYSDDNLPEIY